MTTHTPNFFETMNGARLLAKWMARTVTRPTAATLIATWNPARVSATRLLRISLPSSNAWTTTFCPFTKCDIEPATDHVVPVITAPTEPFTFDAVSVSRLAELRASPGAAPRASAPRAAIRINERRMTAATVAVCWRSSATVVSSSPCDPDGVFERFTEPARMVVVFAQEEARSLGHHHIGTEHLLLGLLRDEGEIPAALLARRGVTLAVARERVVAIVGSNAERPSGQIPFTPNGKKAMERALREALSLGVNHIGTGHLMLGLLREPAGVGSQVLSDLGVLDDLRAELIGAVGPPCPAHWHRATVMWRPEGLELRVPLDLDHGGLAALANDAAWSAHPLAGLEREIWRGWLALRSPTLLDDVDPRELRAAIDGALERVSGSSRERSRAEEFLRVLRED